MPIVGDLDSPDAAGDHLNNFGNPPNNFGDPPNNTRELDSRELSGTQQEHTELVPLMRSVFDSIDHNIYKHKWLSATTTTSAMRATPSYLIAPSHDRTSGALSFSYDSTKKTMPHREQSAILAYTTHPKCIQLLAKNIKC